MNQETRINKIINESLQAFEHLCLENGVNRQLNSGQTAAEPRLAPLCFKRPYNAASQRDDFNRDATES